MNVVTLDDAYAELGLALGAEPEVIEAAYKRLMRKYHPDVNPGGAARAKQITAAYALITDPATPRAGPERSYYEPNPQPPTGSPQGRCRDCGGPLWHNMGSMWAAAAGLPATGSCPHCRAGAGAWRLSWFLLPFLAVLALLWWTTHLPLPVEALIAYAAASLPSGVRVWERLPLRRLAGSGLAGGRLPSWTLFLLPVALIGCVAAPVDIGVAGVRMVLAHREGGRGDDYVRRHWLALLGGLEVRMRRVLH